MRKAIALVTSVGMLAAAGLIDHSLRGPLTTNVWTYASPASAGIVVGDCYHHNVGFELYGTEGPAFFQDQC